MAHMPAPIETFSRELRHSSSSTPSAADCEHNRQTLQAWLTAIAANGAGIIELEAHQRYPIDREPGETFMIDFDGVENLTIRGNGAVISMAGDAGGSGADVYGFFLRNCSNITFENVRFSQRDLTNTGEQAHEVQLGGAENDAVTDVHFVRCHFIEEPTGGAGSWGGDGIRLLGGATTTITNIVIDRCTFDNTHRSGVGVQAGCDEIHIINCTFDNINDQAIDFEPTDDGPLGRFVIAGCHFNGHGGTYVTLSGRDSINHKKSVFAHNTIIGGGLSALNLHGAKIHDNRIERTDNLSDACLTLFRSVDDVHIHHNTLVRTGTTAAGGIAVKHNGGVSPHDFIIDHNIITVSSPRGSGIDVSGSYDFTIDNNTITYNNATTDTSDGFFGVLCLGQVSRPSGVITDNTIKVASGMGRGEAGIWVARDTFASVGAFVITGNRISGCQYDTVFSATIAECADGLPIIANHCGGTGAGADDVGLAVAWSTGHNGRALGAGQYMGTVDPENNVTAAQGSIYVRRNGDSSALYFKQTGASNTGWAQVTVP